MSWFADYCEEAAQTDRLSGNENHVALLATGLFGEAGSVLAELKKTVRERGAYPSYQNRLMEEIGDLLWYFARLVTILAPSDVRKLDESAERSRQRESLLKCVWVAAAPVLCLHSRGTASRSTRRASGSHRRDARSPAACC